MNQIKFSAKCQQTIDRAQAGHKIEDKERKQFRQNLLVLIDKVRSSNPIQIQSSNDWMNQAWSYLFNQAEKIDDEYSTQLLNIYRGAQNAK